MLGVDQEYDLKYVYLVFMFKETHRYIAIVNDGQFTFFPFVAVGDQYVFNWAAYSDDICLNICHLLFYLVL